MRSNNMWTNVFSSARYRCLEFNTIRTFERNHIGFAITVLCVLRSRKDPRANLNWLFRCANQQSHRPHRTLPFFLLGFWCVESFFLPNKRNGKTRKDDGFRVIYQRKRLDVCIRAANKVVRIFIHSIVYLLLFFWWTQALHTKRWKQQKKYM